MSDVECPYCGADQEIDHDDGYGYEEDRVHEQECNECEKAFVFKTSIHFYYEVSKADCLNGAPHNFKATKTYPVKYTKMRCVDCDEERKPTDTEMASIMEPKSEL